MNTAKRGSLLRGWRQFIGEFWQSRLLPWWREYRWPSIGVLWLISWLLGYIGFAREAVKHPEENWTLLGTLYTAAQLFTLESGASLGNGPINWQLEVARWMAPLVAAFTAAEALISIFYDHWQRLRLLNIEDHVVICGLGDKGLLLVKEFRELGHRVVVIEQNESNDLILSCREQGASVLIGNAAASEILNKARVQDAKFLIAVCGDDGVNAEISAHACDLVRNRSGRVLTCSAHIVNPTLWHLLRKWEINTIETFRLQFFNVFDLGARALLSTYPPFDQSNGISREQDVVQEEKSSPPARRRPHLLVVGAGRLGQSLVLQASLQWRAAHAVNQDGTLNEKLRVTLIDKDTEPIKEWLCLRHPELEKVCNVNTYSLDIDSPAFHRAEFLFDERGVCDITTTYICVSDHVVALYAALALHQRAASPWMPIVVRMNENAGLATLLHGVEDRGEIFENVHAFGLLERTCRPEVVTGGTFEMLARAIHTEYVRNQEVLGKSVEDNAAMVEWDALSEETKESNRREADHLGSKLRAVGCDVGPISDWNTASFVFTPQEIEVMAKMEHERWLTERRLAGWTHGARNPQQKTNPYLIPWEDLPEETRKLNRDMVCDLPSFLARAGFQIYRLQSL